MKVIEQNKSIITGVARSVKQTISEDHIAKAAYLVRDQLYSDKRKATFCETLLNAVDEHRKHNIERPVEVIITSKMLIIRDFAKGLSPDKVEQVFFQFFESTKSTNNESIGGFGIGAKAPGSYADIYYVDSYFNGKKYSYVSTVNGYEASASLLAETNCDVNNTGICVRVPIKQDTLDASYFKDLAYDMSAQVGFFTDKQEIKVYLRYRDSKLQSVFTYEDWEEYRLSNNIEECKFEKFKDSKKITQFGDIALVFSDFAFSSSFFRKSYHFAYDGDMIYPLQLTQEQLQKLNIRRPSYSTILFFFKRGSLAILPSREGIVTSPAFDSWLDNKGVQLENFFKEAAPKKIQEELNSTNNLSIVNCRYRSWFGPFYPYADRYWPSFAAIVESVCDIKLNSGRAISWVGPMMASTGRHERYYLINDTNTSVSKVRLMSALREYLIANSIKGINTDHIISFISAEKQQEFEDLVKQSGLFRKGPDFTYVSEIEQFLPEPAKRQSSSIPPKPFAYKKKYSVSDIKETLVFTKEERENNWTLRSITAEYGEGDYSVFGYLKRFGISECAMVSKRAKEKYIKEGAKTFDAINIDLLIKDSIKHSKFIFCPSWILQTVNTKFLQNLSDIAPGWEFGPEYYTYAIGNSILSSRAFHRIRKWWPDINQYITELIEQTEKLFVDQMEALPNADKERMVKFITTNHSFIDSHLSSFVKLIDKAFDDKQTEYAYIQSIFVKIFDNIIKTVTK